MKRKRVLTFIFCLMVCQVFSQVAIGIGTTSPHSSAIVDIKSNSKGLLIPRMTIAQRNAIPNPAEGLEIFSTTDQVKYFFNGTTWQETFSENYNAYYQIYAFTSPSGGTGNSTTPINMSSVTEVFNSSDATYAQKFGTNSIKILENGLYALELTGRIIRGGSNENPLTGRYILRKNNTIDLASCYESLGQVYTVNNSTNVGATFPPLLLQNGDILTIRIQNVDGSAANMNLFFQETILSITKI